MESETILTSECESCIHGVLNERNRSKIIVHCNLKNRDYIYGQRVPCDRKYREIEHD